MQYIKDYGLEDLYSLNDSNTQKKIIAKITQNPSPVDGEGYIYGYFNTKDNNNKFDFKIKLGRTSLNDPQERIKEWNDSKQMFSIYTKYNRKMESIVHLLFNFTRKIKYINEITGEEKWAKYSGLLLREKKKPNITRQIEWFHFTDEFKINNNIITKNNIINVVSILDELLNDLHESKLSSDSKSFDDIPNTITLTLNVSELISDISSDNNSISNNDIPLIKFDDTLIDEKSLTDILNINNTNNILDENIKNKINDIIKNNSKSKATFNVKDRQYLFDTIIKLYENDPDGQIESIKNQKNNKKIIDEYNNNEYFHVNKRKDLFSSIQKYM